MNPMNQLIWTERGCTGCARVMVGRHVAVPSPPPNAGDTLTCDGPAERSETRKPGLHHPDWHGNLIS